MHGAWQSQPNPRISLSEAVDRYGLEFQMEYFSSSWRLVLTYARRSCLDLRGNRLYGYSNGLRQHEYSLWQSRSETTTSHLGGEVILSERPLSDHREVRHGHSSGVHYLLSKTIENELVLRKLSPRGAPSSFESRPVHYFARCFSISALLNTSSGGKWSS